MTGSDPTPARDRPLEDALRAYFEATSGAHDPRARDLATLAGRELSRGDADAVRAQLDPSELAAWDEDIAALEALWPAEPRAAPVDPTTRRRRRLLGTLGGAALLAAAVALLVARPADSELRFKGGPAAGAPEWSLQIGVKRGHQRFVLGPGGTLRTDDQLGFFYSAAAPAHLIIAYVDADGAIVRLFPRDSDLAKRVPAGREVRLDAGATLTGAAGCEWVVGALAAEPFDFASLAAELRRARAAADPCALPLDDTPQRTHRAVLIHR
ncbi:MAG: hypothetical protein CVU56_14745 [Deltaproteobacteria bacterium HGW-Deltaproteobacteria-14]|jgi:hypothetical protein|nr:MAG: hypothetical protein CVU56_14745 [Deltaproteobacteria bacterium HGW-Deltaproteobacteria-14]